MNREQHEEQLLNAMLAAAVARNPYKETPHRAPSGTRRQVVVTAKQASSAAFRRGLRAYRHGSFRRPIRKVA